MTHSSYLALAVVILATGCVDGATSVDDAMRPDQSGPLAETATTASPLVQSPTDDIDADGWMSSTCSSTMSSQQLWEAIDSGSHDVYVLRGLEIIGEEEIQERTGTGVLESRALRISLKNPVRVANSTDTNPEHALLFLEDSRVFHSDEGLIYRERACDRSSSVELEGSLSSRVLAGSSRSVMLLVQSTSQLGPVVRQVAVIVGDSVRLSEQQHVPLSSIEEAATTVRLARLTQTE